MRRSSVVKLVTFIIMMMNATIVLGQKAPEGQMPEELQDSLKTVYESIFEQDAIAYFDVPDDILRNLNISPGQLRRPSAGGPVKKKPTTKPQNQFGKIDGFRIEVFRDGRNPATLQARARARGNAIVSKFPKYRGQIYSFSSSPNWFTRIGNFRTSQEASAALAELKRAFPNFAAEMRVVKSQVTILK